MPAGRVARLLATKSVVLTRASRSSPPQRADGRGWSPDAETMVGIKRLDDPMVRLEGWFQDTLPRASISSLAVMRLGGDMYPSTMEALVHLYPKLATSGYCIVDDYSAVQTCREAVEDRHHEHAISDALIEIDWADRLWRKGGA